MGGRYAGETTGEELRICRAAVTHRITCICQLCHMHINYIYTVGLMAALWKNNKSVTTWNLPRRATFREKYGSIQDQLKALSCMDELLSGEHFVSAILFLQVCTYVNDFC